MSKTERTTHLEPLLAQLNPSEVVKDEKLGKLFQIINDRCQIAKAKVIIFVELHDTAVYLDKHLRKRFRPGVRVACTIVKNGSRVSLKSLVKREEIRDRFAPKANGQKEPGDYEVLICTDADGVGVNLQDADTVVNYDLSGGAGRLVQRLGRILRPTTDAARVPYLYTFIPDWGDTSHDSRTRTSINARFDRFRARSVKSSAILQTTLLGTEPVEELSFDGDLDLEALLADVDNLARTLGSTSIAAHIAKLEEHRIEATALADSVMSARIFDGAYSLLVLIFEAKNFPHPISLVFNPRTSTVESEEETEILRLLTCERTAQRALVAPGIILRDATTAIASWCSKHNVLPKDTKRLVTLYLLPATQVGEKSQFMDSPSVPGSDKKKRRY